jgi:exodeoxyribonuclease V beta subunit
MRLAFGEGTGSTLVLIGDPKQAIYAFRGADVYAYLDAARTAGASATLDVNWRSDQGLIDAYDRMFGGARLGHEGIVYRPVRAAPSTRPLACRAHPARRRSACGSWRRADVGTTQGGYAMTDGAREHIAEDLAADVVALLSSPAEIEERTEEGGTAERVPIAPGHVAVLVRRNRDAQIVRDALDAAGVPAVLNGAGSVFETAAAGDWLRLLEALERPSYPPRVKAAARTAFLGWRTEAVAGASEEEWETVHRRLHGWAYVLRTQGVAALTERITLVEGLPARVLGSVDGERRLTDLRHVAQLLHAAAMEEQMAVAALTGWLRRRIAAAEQEADEARSRRLESDAEAVQVLTIHRSKGLEFPVVYLPYLWHPTWQAPDAVPVTFHDAADGDQRKARRRARGAGLRGEQAQGAGRAARGGPALAYVALTRAKHQAVVWWAGTRDSRDSPLGRLLFARAEDGTVAESGASTPTDADAVARFRALAAEAPGCIAVERSTLGTPASWSGPPGTVSELSASAFDRRLDLRWRRTSYSDITAGVYDARVASEPEEEVVEDELTLFGASASSQPATTTVRCGRCRRSWPTCRRACTSAPSCTGCSRRPTSRRRPWTSSSRRAWPECRLGVGSRSARRRRWSTGCAPLWNPARSLARRSAALRRRALGPPRRAGVRASAGRRRRAERRLTLAAIGAVLRRHVPAGDPLAGYAARLEDPVLRQDVRGFLTGSIDLVARLPDETGVPRFAIVDYKTNWLGTPGEELTAWDYRPAALASEMQRSHYVLQALLYAVALHRYLRWRLDGYDASRNLAGVAYLFLRGMTGRRRPWWTERRAASSPGSRRARLVEELSDVLDHGAAA